MASVWHHGLVEAFPCPQAKMAGIVVETQTAAAPEETNEDMTICRSPPQSPTTTARLTPFFSLPAEIRNRIYALAMSSICNDATHPPPPNHHRLPTSLFLVSSQIHREASHAFYSTKTFRLFPLQEFKPLPTVSELPARYRPLVTNVELILGPGWTAPPKSWHVSPSMARILSQLSGVRCLRVFVEIDPSHPVFARFRVSHGFYTNFAGSLLQDVLAAMPQVEFVQLDGNPSVQINGPLVSRLSGEIEAHGRTVRWGKESGWSAADRSGAQAEIRSQGCVDWTQQDQRPGPALRNRQAVLA